MQQKSVIYCRVSSERQVNEGHGLDGQELRCRQYSDANDYKVVAVFRDEGISGGKSDRPGMKALIAFLDDSTFEEEIVVLIDDISRIARDVEVHFELKAAIESRNARLESPSHDFQNNPMGKFFETIMAGSAEYYRNENRVRVMKNMKSRLDKGYWPFDQPPGLKNINDPVHGKLLTPDEPKATIIREALRGFLSRRFDNRADVQRFLEDHQFTHRAKYKGTVHPEQVKRLLTRILYAGWIEYPKWGVARKKGHHEGLITIDEFDAIQERLAETEHAPQRKDAHKDFPLRNYLACSSCNELVTASWSKGRSKSYPYYRCTTKDCPRRNKGIRGEKVEMDFEKVLSRLRPKKESLKLVEAILKNLWDKRLDVQKEAEENREKQIRETDAEIDKLCDRLGRLTGEIIIKKYESRIEQLEEKKNILRRQSSDEKDPRQNFGTAFKYVLRFTENPLALWKTGIFEDQRLVLKLSILGVLPYDPKLGFGTVTFPLLFQLCKQSETDKSKMVEMPGIEPGSNV
ncbi:MAG: recombinase family protein [Candidatus Peregrinibacteria bacterium]|nr:recombinase family protein [Candidatus Peregrinibacteria bacterium]